MDELKELLRDMDWELIKTSLDFSEKAFREYDYRKVWPNDYMKAYEFKNEQIASAKKAKRDITRLKKLID